MKYSYNWLKEYIPKMPKPEKLVDLIMLRAFEVEALEKFNKDYVLDIKILPNRASDCLSHFGMAREIAAIIGTNYEIPSAKIKEDKSLRIEDHLSIEVEENNLCPRYSARLVSEVEVKESPQIIQERLIACGLRPINNIVDIMNYVMLELGQPLHAFDFEKVADINIKRLTSRYKKNHIISSKSIKKIKVRRAKKGEKITTLDGDEYKLNKNILVIADEQNPLAIAGIKGGKKAEIDKNTKTIIIEAANFDAVNIRKSSRQLNLKTEASWRFENKPDPNLTILALQRAADLILKFAGGRVAKGIIDIAKEIPKPWIVDVNDRYIESLLGVKIELQKILTIFKNLGLEAKQIKKGKEVYYQVNIPTYRADLFTPEDLIEEVARLYGLEKIPAIMPTSILIPAIRNEEIIYADNLRDILVGLGFSEVYNYSFISEFEKNFYNLTDLAELENPLSQEQKYLRPNLLVGLIKNIKENLKYFSPGSGFVPYREEIRLFEIGQTFTQRNKKFIEVKKFAGIIYKKKSDKNLFYELKGVLEVLLNKLGLVGVWDDEFIQEGLPVSWQRTFHPTILAQIKIGDKLVGWVGILHPEVKNEWKIEGETGLFEFDFKEIVNQIMSERVYQKPSRYPAITRDISILVDSRTKIDDVENIIENAGTDILVDVDLFDIYEGEELEEDQKSLSFHLVFQSDRRNLTDAEVNRIMDKIVKALKEEGWEIRR